MTNIKKQTPVRWLVDKLTYIRSLHYSIESDLYIDRALQMETQKQQKYDEMLAMLEKASDALTSSDADLRNEIEQLIKESVIDNG